MIYANINPAADLAMEHHHLSPQQEPDPCCQCDECGGDIYAGESCYFFDGIEITVCENCIPSWAKKYIEMARMIAE